MKFTFKHTLTACCMAYITQAISQWASFFAETGLNVSKTAGDILGTCFFAILMGTGRLLYGIFGAKLNLRRTLIFSAVCCVGAGRPILAARQVPEL